MVAVAAVVLMLGHLSPLWLRVLGSILTTTGMMSLLVFVGWDLINWLEMMSPEYRRYSFQHVLFTLGTNTDRPLIQLVAAGSTCWIVGIIRIRKQRAAGKRIPLDQPM